MHRAQTRVSRLLVFVLALSAVLVMFGGTPAYAADLGVGDADTATAGVQSTLALGNFAPGATISTTVGARITCVSDSPQHRHINTGQTATWTIASNGVKIDGSTVTPLAGSTTTVAVGPILAADAFPADGIACPAGPPIKESTTAQNTTINVTAPSTCGSHTLTVDYGNHALSPSGTQDSSSLSGQTDVSYTFTVNPCALNVTVAGTGSGVVHSTDNEIDCPDDADPGDCSHDYTGAPTVSFTATAAANSLVTTVSGTGVSCSGVGTGTANCTIVMSQNRTVTVTFNKITQNLIVAVNGPGRVTSDVSGASDGISCPDIAGPGDCTDTYDQPTAVTLTATPDPNHQFLNWTGPDAAACAGGVTNPVCTVAMTEQRNITANFAWNVNVTVVGNGTVTDGAEGDITCTSAAEVTCSDFYAPGTVVTLTAAPDTNWEFDGWSGADAVDCAGGLTNPVCALTMTEDMDLTATFSTIEWDVSVNVVGNGTVMDGAEGSLSCTAAAELTCTETYDQPAVVTLTATPDTNHEFDGWSGTDASECASLTNPVCSLTMTADKSITATFSIAEWDLNVTVVGNGTVSGDTIGVSDGIDCPDDTDPGDCTDTYDAPTVVTLTATPDTNHEFDNWTGEDAEDCAGGTSNPVCALTMTEQMDVQANFSIIEWDVNLTVFGSGGIVTDGLEGNLSCTSSDEATCSETYDQPTVVTLTAAPDVNWEFDGWSGTDATNCVSVTPDVCELTMTQDFDIAATFSTIQHLVTTSVTGDGDVTADSGTIDCPDVDCDDLYDQASTVTLTAAPDTDNEFDGWSGADSGECAALDNPVCVLTIDAAKTVDATFSTIQWDLTVTINGNGTVTSSPGSINCSTGTTGTCSDTFDQPTEVTLTATPDTNYQLNGWGGADELDCVIAANTCTLTMTEDRDVSANFGLIPRLLSLTVTGSAGTVTDGTEGSTDCDVGNAGTCTELYPHGTSVTLTATPDTNHEFDAWSGTNATDCAGGLTNPVCVLTMDGAKSLTATFSTIQWNVNVTVVGNGTVTDGAEGSISCTALGEPTCSDTYDQPTVVTLTSNPDANNQLVTWSGPDVGDCAEGTNSPTCTLTMTEQRDVTANFGPIKWPLTVAVNGTGSVTSDVGGDDNGIDCPDDGDLGDCSDLYNQPTIVTLTAAAAANNQFVNWTGADAPDCAGGLTNPVCALMMTEVMDVTANFSAIQWPLNVTVVGNGEVTSDVSGVSDGINCPNDADPGDCSETYAQPTVVTLTATPADVNTHFVAWTGSDAPDCVGSLNVCALTMIEQMDVTATFAPTQWDLNLTVVGNGSVTSDVSGTGDGIDCPDDTDPGDCSDTYNQPTLVTLTATPGANAQFDGWSGVSAGSCAGGVNNPVCVIGMNDQRDLTATFSTIQRTLNVTVVGNATVTSDVGGIDCPDDADPGDCTDTYNQPAVVTLTAAVGDPNTQFDGWSGADAVDCAGGLTNPVCALTMTEQMDVTATFSTIQRALNVTVLGSGTVTSDVGGIDCPDDADPGDCSDTYSQPTVVTLTAAPSGQFSGWSGSDATDCAGGLSNPVCALTMTEQMDVTATFASPNNTLNIALAGTGTGTVTDDDSQINCPGDCTGSYPSGTDVILTATNGAGSVFSGWSGLVPGTCTTNPVCTVDMGVNRNVTATFDLETTPEEGADLSVTKFDANDPVTVGQNMVYIVRVTNLGPAAATSVKMVDQLPSGVTFVSVQAVTQGSCTYLSDRRIVRCSLGTIADDGFARVRIVVRPQSAGTYTNRAAVVSPVDDPNHGNNSTSETTTVQQA